MNEIQRELENCLKLASNCIFVIGFGRSCTTVIQQVINSSPDALVLGEAMFHEVKDVGRFRDWYNNRHIGYGNQVSKSTYAPDFVPQRDHTYDEWLSVAAAHFQRLGDKMAFSSGVLHRSSPDKIKSFFEGRFFESRYVLAIRDPMQTLISVQKLISANDVAILYEVAAYAEWIQLWADIVRIFPYTLTLLIDDFSVKHIGEIEDFLGLQLPEAKYLLNVEERRIHDIAAVPILSEFTADLQNINAEIRRALGVDRVLWQADQKRDARLNNSRVDDGAPALCAAYPIGQVWCMAGHLFERVKLRLGAAP